MGRSTSAQLASRVTSAIFVSYRRDDTASATGRLADALAAHFGPDNVFRDIETIESGEDFRSSLQSALRGAQVLLVIIGRSWSVAADSRLQDPGDYVRMEIETALAQGVFVIPVLVEGAQMPAAAALPDSIRSLAYRQAHEMSEARWKYDTERLVDLLARHGLAPLAPLESTRSPVAAAGRTAITVLTRLPHDFIRLIYEPRQFLAQRGSGTYEDLVRAGIFLVASQLTGALLILQEWPTRSGVLDFLSAAPLLILLLVLVLSTPMYLAWRLAGAPREFQRVLIILVYQCSFAGMALSLAVFVVLVGIKLVVPAEVERLARLPSFEGVAALLATLQAAPSQAPWVVASLITYLIGLVTIIWLAIAWRSYGDALGQSGLRSLAALVLFAIFLGVPLGLLVWAAVLVS